MVTSRLQSNRENRIEQTERDTFSDGESNGSLPDFHSNTHFTEDYGTINTNEEREHEEARIEQRFFDMNRHIGKLTSMVKALTEKMANSREENYQNIQIVGTSRRSDNIAFTCKINHSICFYLRFYLALNFNSISIFKAIMSSSRCQLEVEKREQSSKRSEQTTQNSGSNIVRNTYA